VGGARAQVKDDIPDREVTAEKANNAEKILILTSAIFAFSTQTIPPLVILTPLA
jgi:hypothetical protein